MSCRSKISKLLIYLASLWAACCFGLRCARSQTLQRLPDTKTTATTIIDAAGTAWVGTPIGAYRIDGNTATRIPDAVLDVTGLYYPDGHVWIATPHGAYRVDGARAVRVPDRDLVIRSIASVGGRIWIATRQGAYVVDGNNAVRIPDCDLDVSAIVPVDGRPWLATNHGAYIVSSGGLSGEREVAHTRTEKEFTVERVMNFDYSVNEIVEIDGAGWLATDRGAYRVNPANPSIATHIELMSPSNPTLLFTKQAAAIFHIVNINATDQVWLVGVRGAFAVIGDTAVRTPDDDYVVTSLTSTGDVVAEGTRRGLFAMKGNTSTARVPDFPLDVRSVTPIDGCLWVATGTGCYRCARWLGRTPSGDPIDGWLVSQLPDATLSVSEVTEIGGQTYVASDLGGYSINGNQSFCVVSGRVDAIYNAGNSVWMVTPHAVYRLDTNRRLTLRLLPRQPGWAQVLWRLLPAGTYLPGDYEVQAVYVDLHSQNAVPATNVLVAADSSLTGYLIKRRTNQFTPGGEAAVPVSLGQGVVYIAVRDAWNHDIDRSMDIRVIPPWVAIATLVSVGWITFIAGVFLVSPVVPWCHRLLMFSAFRNGASLGLISLALATLSPARKYILLRYRRNLRQALGQYTLSDTSSELPRLQERLLSDRLTTLPAMHGAEPFATARRVARAALDRKGPFASLRGAIPVPLLAFDEEVCVPEELAVRALSEYGAITDSKLAALLLEHTAFFFIMESHPAAAVSSPAAAKPLLYFTARYRVRGYVCIVNAET